MTYTPTFQGQDDRARVLSAIVSFAAPQPGVTLVALVNIATHEVCAVRSIPTPQPLLREDDEGDTVFDAAFVCQLNLLMCDVATELAPPRTRTDAGWSVPTFELVTVVCREGPATLTSTETQFWWGWRYSNHGTAAFDSDVYAVTPEGWVALLGEWSGPVPALPGPEVPAAALDPAVQEAELVLASAADAVLVPRPGECLLCYVARMLDDFGCHTTLRFARRYRDTVAPRATALERRLGSMGGYCDCEILLNGYQLREEFWVPEVFEDDGTTIVVHEACAPETLPACGGVRVGSTRPCTNWERQRRGRW